MTSAPPRPGEPDESGVSGPEWLLAGAGDPAQVVGAVDHAHQWQTHGSVDPAAQWRADGPDGAGPLWEVEGSAGRGGISPDEVDHAARTYWDAEADTYQAEHGAFLAGQHTTEAPPTLAPRGPRLLPTLPMLPTLPTLPTPSVMDSVHETDRIHDTTWVGGEVKGAHGGFVWGPEGLSEAEAQLLGPPADLAGLRILEVGCGAAQCSRWLASQGARAVGVDISVNQLRHALREPPSSIRGALGDLAGPLAGSALRGAAGGLGDPTREPRVVAGSATALPFGDRAFELAFASYGAIQFVGDLQALFAEVARVLRPAGRWVFSVTHPIRWAFPDDPGPAGLTATGSYFDRTPYVERDGQGRAVYAEFHRTVGDYVDSLRQSGFTIEAMVEPGWPEWNEAQWGGWSPLRGTHLPGTLIIGCRAGGRSG